MSFHVLVVDDEKVLQRNLTRALQRVGLATTGVASVGEARRLLAERGADLICLDVRLSDGDGLEYLSELRKDYPDLPVVIMTGQETKANRDRAEALNVAAYLVKPFALERFREIVRCLAGDLGDVAPQTCESKPAILSNGQAQPQDKHLISTALSTIPCRPRRAATKHPERPYSVLMYSHDSIGMGHVRRNSNIARALVRDRKDINVLMLVGCPAGVVFDLPPGVDFVKLPSVVKVERERWSARRLRIGADETLALRSELIARATTLFKPDLFLVDHVPAGVWNELLPTLAALRQQDQPPRVVLGVRDILDDPEVLRRNWREKGTYDVIRNHYDEVLVYGSEKVFACGREYGLDEILPQGVRYCGYLSAEDDLGDPAQLRAELGIDRGRLVLVTAGGGHDAFPMMAATIDAMGRLGDAEEVTTVVVTGPLMDSAQRAELTRRAKGSRIRIVSSINRSLEYLNAADLVVTMAGYNTVVEAIRLGKSVVTVPRAGPSAEQRTRTRLFAEHGLLRGVDPDELSGGRLASVIKEGLEAPPKPKLSLGINGVEEAVRQLNRLLGQERATVPAPGGAVEIGAYRRSGT